MLLRRRAFLTFLGCALVSLPARSVSQQTRVRTVGVFFGLSSGRETQARREAFENALKQQGWYNGKNLNIHYRYAEGDRERMKILAQEIVSIEPDCILGHSTPVTEALKNATATIPIIFVLVADPIGSKFAVSLARPGSNVTGFTTFRGTIGGKYLTIMTQLVPELAQVAAVYNESQTEATFLPSFIEAAANYKIEPIVLQIKNSGLIEREFENLSRMDKAGVIVLPENFTSMHQDLFVAFAAKYRIPAIYPYRFFAERGGLISYGVDTLELFRQAAGYVSRILRGENPSNLPIQAPTKFELVINLRTANDFHLKVPDVLIASADELID